MTEAVKQLQERMSHLETEVARIRKPLLQISDHAARTLILDLIERSKLVGKREFDAFELQSKLHLPFAQISKIMKRLRKKVLFMEKFEVSIVEYHCERWLLLNEISNAGLLRAASVSKPRHVQDFDKHHCEEVSVHTSIRYNRFYF